MKLNTFPKWFAFIIIVMVIVSCVIAGCKTTEKTVDRSKEIRDSIAQVEGKKWLAEMQKQREHYESRLREMEYLQADFKECPPVINADSLRMALTASGCDSNDIASLRKELNRSQARYQRLADGSVIIEGNLQSVTDMKNKQADTIKEITADRLRLAEELTSTKTELSVIKKNQSKEVVRKPATLWYWVLFIAGLVSGALLWDRFGAKIKAKFKQLKS